MTDLPRSFTLYGGTAVALRLGHRTSIDFDFFTHDTISESDKERLLRALPWLAGATVLQNRMNTLTVSTETCGDPVKVSFFGGILTGRVGEPDADPRNGVAIASLADLMAHKLKCLHDRAEGKDYQDIAAMIANGVSLAQGLADRVTLFGTSVPVMETVKALVWFDDIGEPWRLPSEGRELIKNAASELQGELPSSLRLATTLN
jgi:hypothetical protein